MSEEIKKESQFDTIFVKWLHMSCNTGHITNEYIGSIPTEHAKSTVIISFGCVNMYEVYIWWAGAYLCAYIRPVRTYT